MGIVKADIELVNAVDLERVAEGEVRPEAVRRAAVEALVDTGSIQLVIPETLRQQLGLRVLRRRRVRLADGSVGSREVAGPIEVRLRNRATTTTAIVMPDPAEVLLGAIPMEDLDVSVDPLTQRLIPNPESPDEARSLAVSCWAFGPSLDD